MSDRVNEAIEAAKKAADHHCAKHRIKDCEEIRQEAYFIAMEEIRAHPDAPTNHIAQRVKCGLIDAYRKERLRKGIALDEWRIEGGRDAAQTLEEEKERKLFLAALKKALSYFGADERVIIERRVIIGEKLRDLQGVTAARANALRDAFRERFRLELEEIKRVGDEFDFFNEFMDDDEEALFYGLESNSADEWLAAYEDGVAPTITPRALRNRAKQDLKKMGRRESLRELIKAIPEEGETLHVVSSGKFNFWTYVPVINELINQPIDVLYCASWMVGAQCVKELFQLMDAGIVRESRWVVGAYLKSRDPEVYRQLLKLEEKKRGWVKAMETHIKLILIDSPPYYLTVTGSANMSENKRLEGTQLTNDRDVYEFYKIVLDEAKGL